jgi:membrane protein CcdC involved in cytochrome C biogenesis
MDHTLVHTDQDPNKILDDQHKAEVMRRSASIYLSIAVGMAILFFVAAYFAGDYPTVAKIGGMLWVGLLSLIISMPIVTARVKKKLQK